MWRWIAMIVIATAAPILTEKQHHHKKENCDIAVADAISKFVTSSVGHSHNLLLWTAGVEGDGGGVGVDMVRRLGEALRLDLVDPGQQTELALLVCYAPSLTFLSRAFEIDFEVIDDFMDTYINKVYFHKKLDVLFKLGDILMEMVRWTRRTGYPTTPLRHQDPEDVLAFLQGMEDRLLEDADVRHLWVTYNRHFPLGQEQDLGEVALLLTGEHSLTRVAEQLDLEGLELEQLAVLDDSRLYQYQVNVAATLRLYKVLDDYGITRLDWK